MPLCPQCSRPSSTSTNRRRSDSEGCGETIKGRIRGWATMTEDTSSRDTYRHWGRHILRSRRFHVLKSRRLAFDFRCRHDLKTWNDGFFLLYLPVEGTLDGTFIPTELTITNLSEVVSGSLTSRSTPTDRPDRPNGSLRLCGQADQPPTSQDPIPSSPAPR